MKSVVNILALGIVAIGIIATLLINNLRQDREKYKKQVHDICGVTKAGIEGTARSIRSNASNKEAAIGRIFGDGDVTGSTLLNGCTPTFDSDKWNECVFNNDEPCMLKMLDAAAKSIPD